MKIYIEHDKEFYDFSQFDFETVEHQLKINCLNYTEPYKTEKRDFEIGARVYFENVGWTEVIEKMGCGQCAFENVDLCGDKRCVHAGTEVIFKKISLAEKQEEPKQADKFYVLNIKTGITNFIHESEESAKTEAARLALKQPGDIFRILKVVGECVGKVNVEWGEK